MTQRTQIVHKIIGKLTKFELGGRLGAPKWPMTAPGGPAPAHSAPKMAQSDLPEGPRGLQEAPLDPPEAAKGTP